MSGYDHPTSSAGLPDFPLTENEAQNQTCSVLNQDRSRSCPNRNPHQRSVEHGRGSEDWMNDRNVAQLVPSDRDLRMATVQGTADGCSRHIYANNHLSYVSYPVSSQGNHFSQSYSSNPNPTPHISEHHQTSVHHSGQSQIYRFDQNYAAEHSDYHNNDLAQEQIGRQQDLPLEQNLAGRASRSPCRSVYSPSPSYRLHAVNSMNVDQLTVPSQYEDPTGFLQPRHYSSLAPQTDPGQLNLHYAHTFSNNDPWSVQNQRNIHLALASNPTTIEDQRVLRLPDAYSSVGRESRDLSNASSDRERLAPESSVGSSVESGGNDMTDSTTTLKPRPQPGNISEILYMGPAEHQSGGTGSMDRSLNNGYDLVLPGVQPQDRSGNLGQGFETHLASSACSASPFEVPRQQQSVESSASSPASAPYTSPPEIVERTCPFCSKIFRRQYGKGNLARHVRSKHGSSERVYCCKAPACPKVFKRTDARLKHHRKHHPELKSAPALSRKAHL